MTRGTFRAMPFAKWPQSDRLFWIEGTKPAHPLDTPGVGARWRPATKVIVREAYAVGLRWLDDKGWLDPASPPAARWTRPRLRAYMRDLSDAVRPDTVRHRLVNLERAIAVLDPLADRTLLRTAAAGLSRKGSRSRKRARLQEPAALVELGFRLMSLAEEGPHASLRKNATLYRVGLQVALLAQRPLRMRNFSAVRIGHHLVREKGHWHFRFDGSETKNHRPIEVPLPKSLLEPMERYIAHFRPLLAGKRYHGDRLWVSYRFQAESAHTMQLSIVRVTQAAFGEPVNPHLFRDCAATSIAINDPAAVRMAATILGHASFSTTEKHYNLAHSLEAGRIYAAEIEALRKRSRGAGRRKPIRT